MLLRRGVFHNLILDLPDHHSVDGVNDRWLFSLHRFSHSLHDGRGLLNRGCLGHVFVDGSWLDGSSILSRGSGSYRNHLLITHPVFHNLDIGILGNGSLINIYDRGLHSLRRLSCSLDHSLDHRTVVLNGRSLGRVVHDGSWLDRSDIRGCRRSYDHRLVRLRLHVFRNLALNPPGRLTSDNVRNRRLFSLYCHIHILDGGRFRLNNRLLG